MGVKSSVSAYESETCVKLETSLLIPDSYLAAGDARANCDPNRRLQLREDQEALPDCNSEDVAGCVGANRIAKEKNRHCVRAVAAMILTVCGLLDLNLEISGGSDGGGS